MVSARVTTTLPRVDTPTDKVALLVAGYDDIGFSLKKS